MQQEFSPIKKQSPHLIYAKNQKRPSLSFRHAARQSGREEKWETGDGSNDIKVSPPCVQNNSFLFNQR
jgi:hypothetical protein